MTKSGFSLKIVEYDFQYQSIVHEFDSGTVGTSENMIHERKFILLKTMQCKSSKNALDK